MMTSPTCNGQSVDLTSAKLMPAARRAAAVASGIRNSILWFLGIPAVKAGVVESECCHGRVPAPVPQLVA